MLISGAGTIFQEGGGQNIKSIITLIYLFVFYNGKPLILYIPAV